MTLLFDKTDAVSDPELTEAGEDLTALTSLVEGVWGFVAVIETLVVASTVVVADLDALGALEIDGITVLGLMVDS